MKEITRVGQAEDLLKQQTKLLSGKMIRTLALSPVEAAKIARTICDVALVFADAENRETLCKQAVLLAERSWINEVTNEEIIALSDALSYTIYTLVQLT